MVKKYQDFERGESASETGRTYVPPRVFKEMAQLGQLKEMLMQRLSEVTPLNTDGSHPRGSVAVKEENAYSHQKGDFWK
ncbi:MAG: hypothetical protein ACI4PH_05665 [Faecousia sp.]